MKAMKTLVSILLAGALTASVFSGCGKKGKAAHQAMRRVAKRLKSPFGKRRMPRMKPSCGSLFLTNSLKSMLEIELEFLVTPWESWNEKYSAAFAGGTPPDVSYMTEGFPNFVAAGQLEDLTPYITDELKDKYTDALWSSGEYDGVMARVPFLNLTSIVFYNKALLEADGVEIPQTWDELLAAAQTLTKDTDGDGKTDQWGYFLNHFTGEISIHQTAPYIYQSGGTFLNEDETALGFNNEEGIRGLDSSLI